MGPTIRHTGAQAPWVMLAAWATVVATLAAWATRPTLAWVVATRAMRITDTPAINRKRADSSCFPLLCSTNVPGFLSGAFVSFCTSIKTFHRSALFISISACRNIAGYFTWERCDEILLHPRNFADRTDARSEE